MEPCFRGFSTQWKRVSENLPHNGSRFRPLFHTMEACFPHRGKPRSGEGAAPSAPFGGANRPRRAVPPLAPSRRPAALGAWMGGGRRAHAKSAKPDKEVGGMREVKRGLSRGWPLFPSRHGTHCFQNFHAMELTFVPMSPEGEGDPPEPPGHFSNPAHQSLDCLTCPVGNTPAHQLGKKPF